MLGSFLDELEKIAASPRALPDGTAERLLARYDQERREKYLQGIGEQANPWNVPETALQAAVAGASVPVLTAAWNFPTTYRTALLDLKAQKAFEEYGRRTGIPDVPGILSRAAKSTQPNVETTRGMASLQTLLFGESEALGRMGRGAPILTGAPTPGEVSEVRKAILDRLGNEGWRISQKTQTAFNRAQVSKALRGAARSAAPLVAIGTVTGALAAYKRYRDAQEKIHAAA